MRRVRAPLEDGALTAEMIERHFSAASVNAMILSASFNEMVMAERRVAPLSGSPATLRHFADSLLASILQPWTLAITALRLAAQTTWYRST